MTQQGSWWCSTKFHSVDTHAKSLTHRTPAAGLPALG